MVTVYMGDVLKAAYHESGMVAPTPNATCSNTMISSTMLPATTAEPLRLWFGTLQDRIAVSRCNGQGFTPNEPSIYAPFLLTLAAYCNENNGQCIGKYPYA
jgi:hypothetical protein